MTRSGFIAAYVRRARAAGFAVEPTGDGCVYAPQPETPDGLRFWAWPCSCGCAEGWGMFLEPETER